MRYFTVVTCHYNETDHSVSPTSCALIVISTISCMHLSPFKISLTH